MSIINTCKEKVLSGESVSAQEAYELMEADLEKLSAAADEIREKYQGKDFDICCVLSIKGGRCSENCRFCPQASVSDTTIPSFPLLKEEGILEDAKRRSSQGIRHYCLVSSGRRLGDKDIDTICETIRRIRKETNLSVCASMGLLGETQLRKLKDAGVVRIHNNLETSRAYFPELCTSHTYEEKLDVIRAAKKVGLELCCGGIFGTGESMKDRVDMALLIRELDVQSVPVNVMNPVKGTPLGDRTPLSDAEVRRIIALFKFILPRSYVRLAAGRNFLSDTGLACFEGGANAAITGDCLTVEGIGVKEDMAAIKEMGIYHLEQTNPGCDS